MMRYNVLIVPFYYSYDIYLCFIIYLFKWGDGV